MTAKCEFKLLIHSARQVVQVVSNGDRVVRGPKMKHVDVLESSDTGGISVVVSNDGVICDIGADDVIMEKYSTAHFISKIDATGKAVLPGLVDAHTHPVWAGDRVKEFAMKLAGATYMDIHKSGGGIHYTVSQTREASEEKLLQLFKARLQEMLKAGTTLLEAKSGYGLDTDTEMKLLRVIERGKGETPVEISSTFCGAHAVPRSKTPEEATDAVLNQQLPELNRMMAVGEISVDSIDVFCEKDVFNIEQSRKILQAGRKLGLRLNFHGDELHPLGAAEMGAELKAEAISHLEEISDKGIDAMAKAGSIAVILPTTAYILKLRAPPVRKMIDAEIAVALGSDFNPNAFCLSMPLIMHLACVLCHMSMPEALNAATINAAAALGKSDTHGSIEVGKCADMIILNADRWEHLIYQMGCHNSLIAYVIKKGKIVSDISRTTMVH